MEKYEEKIEVKTTVKFLVWQCSKSSQARGASKTKGTHNSTPSNPCGLWNIRRAKKFKPMQMDCAHCDNRPRKGPGHWTVFDSKESALIEVARRNPPPSIYADKFGVMY